MAFFFYPACVASPGRPPGYEDDERGSLGKRGDCRRWREKGAERSAAVCVQRSRTIGKAHTGHRKPGGRTDAEKLSGQAHIESCLRNHNPPMKLIQFYRGIELSLPLRAREVACAVKLLRSEVCFASVLGQALLHFVRKHKTSRCRRHNFTWQSRTSPPIPAGRSYDTIS